MREAWIVGRVEHDPKALWVRTEGNTFSFCHPGPDRT